jgi:hypothetical protein
VAEVLRALYGFDVVLLGDASRAEILDALDEAVEELTPSDNLLIYYAGHGHLDKDTDEGFWLPVTARPNRRSEWISNNEIRDTLEKSAARHALVIADSCFSGVLTRQADFETSGGPTEQPDRYYERLASAKSRTALSSGDLTPVDDGGGGQNSIFAKALLEALKSNDRRYLEGEALHERIRRPVTANSMSGQDPTYRDIRQAGHEGGDFLFWRPSGKWIVDGVIPDEIDIARSDLTVAKSLPRGPAPRAEAEEERAKDLESNGKVPEALEAYRGAADLYRAAADQHAVEDAIERYRRAMETRDITALARLWPSLGEEGQSALGSYFNTVERISVELKCQYEVGGGIATAECEGVDDITFRDGDHQKVKAHTTFRLRKRDHSWQIEESTGKQN